MEISKKEFLKIPELPGVYTFWKSGKPIYIGKSVNLKSRLGSYLLPNLGVKTAQMVSEAESVSYIVVTSELESLLLEASQIRKYQPKYNIISKDDKHALYIGVTKEEFPRVVTLRKTDLVKLDSYFGPFPNSTNVKTILKHLRRIFPYSDHKIGKKACLYSHLGLCNPCPNIILQKDGEELKKLKTIYRKNIRNIKMVLSKKFNFVRKDLENQMLSLSKEQMYEEAKIIRDKIRAFDYITQNRISEESFLENPNLAIDLRNEELLSLAKISGIKKLNRIECFDIAHLSGASATASMVVLINGEKENSEYRNFRIRQNKKQSDYDSMREVANRRYKNLASWDRPDLIIVDGGLGQVNIFSKVFEKENIPVLGIAKHPDRLIFPDGRKIKLEDKALSLVARIRDEAHRFARRYHHKLVTKELLTELKP